MDRSKRPWYAWLILALAIVCVSCGWGISLARCDDGKRCAWEEAQAIAICRTLGRKSPECKKATQDYNLCLAENATDDPIDRTRKHGIRCITRCNPPPPDGNGLCTTYCTGA